MMKTYLQGCTWQKDLQIKMSQTHCMVLNTGTDNMYY